jgi:divinyl chlorophyllide a 8-vinyl-reductase
MTAPLEQPPSPASKRIFMLGATGTIGRATVRALVRRGQDVVCLVRAGSDTTGLDGATLRLGDVADPQSLADDGLGGEHFDILLSCLASRSGVPDDAWAIDYQAHVDALAAARAAGVEQVVLLSAICVQHPRLAFQHAKLAFEAELIASSLTYSIVRPTAFFKSLSGQVGRVRRGKPFLLFGDGRATACKPISDTDLADYLADCVGNPDRANRILPIGGPGPAITPREQGELLFALTGQAPRFRAVSPALLKGVAAVLDALGTIVSVAKRKAELARIGHYYATESMLVRNAQTGAYDADATPETGSDTLADHYRAILAGERPDERGDHAVF